jgi:hypothetical protein
MLAKNPEDRFQTPEEVQEAVEQTAARLSAEFSAIPERIVAETLPSASAAALSERRIESPEAMLATLASGVTPHG